VHDPIVGAEDGVEPVDYRDVLTDLPFKFNELRALTPGNESREELAAFDLLEHIGDRRNVCCRPVWFMRCHPSHSLSEDSESHYLDAWTADSTGIAVEG
jgi:hypothetical protein